MTTVRRQRRIDGDVMEKITELALKGWMPAQVHRHLEKDERFASRLPDVRTIQRQIKDVMPADESGRWSLVDSNPSDARLVLHTLADVVRSTQGRISGLTRKQAELVIRVRRAAPDLPLRTAFEIALVYIARDAKREGVDDLDTFLAFAPWRGPWEMEEYDKAVEEGWVKQSYESLMISRGVSIAQIEQITDENDRRARESSMLDGELRSRDDDA